MKILLTGFTPYGGDSLNASQELIRALAADAPRLARGMTLAFEILRTEHFTVGTDLAAVFASHAPDCALLFGQAPGRDRVCFELQATNNYQGRRIRPQGVAAYRSTLPATDALIQALQAAGIVAGHSECAGDFVCNQALYLALEHAYARQPPLPVGFVHIPVLPSQAQDTWPGAPHMSLETLREVVAIVLRTLQRRG